MTQLRYVAIAAVILAGCRKETKPAAAPGSGSAATSIDAAAPAPDPAGAPDAATPPRPAAQGEQCPDGTPCDTGLTCVKFVGVTGRPLATCEIPCDQGTRCPDGQACASVKDGPGQVCQPRSDGGAGGAAGGSGAAGGKGGGSGAAGGKGGGSGAAGGKGGGSGATSAARQGEPCATGQCAPGLACVEYYGIAGARGPKFTSCEIRCGGGGTCPAGQQCITIADGPGQVCRP